MVGWTQRQSCLIQAPEDAVRIVVIVQVHGSEEESARHAVADLDQAPLLNVRQLFTEEVKRIAQRATALRVLSGQAIEVDLAIVAVRDDLDRLGPSRPRISEQRVDRVGLSLATICGRIAGELPRIATKASESVTRRC